MNGLKTILALICSAFIVPLLAKRGLTLTQDQQLELVAFGMAAVGVLMRFFSNGPALADIRAWFWALTIGRHGSAVDVNEVTNAVIVELKRRNAMALAKARAAAAERAAQTTPAAPIAEATKEAK